MLKDRPIFGHLVGDYSKTVNVIAPKFYTMLQGPDMQQCANFGVNLTKNENFEI